MTLEELDQALEKTGLDLTNPPDMEARNMVLARYGQSIINSKKERCAHCWHRENGKCSPMCDVYDLPSDPVEVSKRVLCDQNDIQVFPFLCLFVVPVYEELTGNKDTMKKLAAEYKRLWKKYYGNSEGGGS